eukprot:Rmarinus@m.28983
MGRKDYERLPGEPIEEEVKASIHERLEKNREAYYLVLLLGTGTLLPWNAIITAIDYFSFIFNESEHLEDNVNVYFGNAYNYPNLLGLIFLINYGNQYSLESRIKIGLYLFLAMFTFVPFIDMFGLGLEASFALTLLAVGVMGAATSICLGSLFGLAGVMGPCFTEAVMSGNGISGLVVVFCRVLTKAILRDDEDGIDDDEKESRLYLSTWIYFSTAVLTVLACITGFNRLLRLPDVKAVLTPGFDQPSVSIVGEDDSCVNEENVALVDFSGEDGTYSADNVPQWLERMLGTRVSVILFHIRHAAICVCVMMAVTLSLFPGITVQIDSEDGLGDWMPIVLIGIFTMFDWIGRAMPSWAPVLKQDTLNTVVFLRSILCYPLFFMALPSSFGDKVYPSDAIMFLIMATFALSNGYFSSCAMILGPSGVPTDSKDTAGIIMTAFLNSGLTLGSTISIPLSFLIRDDEDEDDDF